MQQTGPGTFIVIPLRELFGFLIRGLPLAAVLSALAVGAVAMLARERPVTWTATAHLLSVRQDHAPTVVRGIIPGSLDPTLYRSAVVDGPVLDVFRENHGLASPLPDQHTMLSNLRVESDNQLQTSVVRVSYRAADPELAAEVANGIAAELVSWDRERTLRPLQDWRNRLEAELAAIDSEIASAAAAPAEGVDLRSMQLAREQRLSDLAELQSTVPLSQLSLLTPATAPVEADGRGLVSSSAIAIVFATLAAYLFQLWLQTRRPHRPTQVEVEPA